jgi:hypothetical protein
MQDLVIGKGKATLQVITTTLWGVDWVYRSTTKLASCEVRYYRPPCVPHARVPISPHRHYLVEPLQVVAML